jgi:hypothetical protein
MTQQQLKHLIEIHHGYGLRMKNMVKPWFLRRIEGDAIRSIMAYCMYHGKVFSDYETVGLI